MPGMTASFEQRVAGLVDEFRRQRPLRAGSLIITVYGDAIAPRGGTVWLGSLIRLLEPFGLSERLTRTAAYRLVQDDWLKTQPIGRRSYYSLTDNGRRRFENATRRIYSRPPNTWDHRWCFVMLPPVHSGTDRDVLRKELGWQGFGLLRPGVMAHPSPDTDVLSNTLDELDASNDVIVMQAEGFSRALAPMQRLVEECWRLDELESRYEEFVARFEPVLAATSKRRNLDTAASLRARMLLIHEYRKILLRDPRLPRDLLPQRWPGEAAYDLCRRLYRRLHASADGYLGEMLETIDGSLPEPAEYFFQRFGGLPVKT